MMRWMVIALFVVAAPGCKKKPALVQTPVMELDPLGGARPAPVPVAQEETSGGAPQPAGQPTAAPDGGAPHQKVVVAPKTTNTPSVASPYMPGGGRDRLPMWRQRSKFY
jgi:hypothetical protein